MMFLPLLIIIPLVWFLLPREQRDRISSAFNGRKSPLDIARERYAKGEITKEQYEQIKKDIS
jgi:putative membrane protein